MYWAQALSKQNDDKELKEFFSKAAEELTENESKIIEELNAAQGKPVDIGGYYYPDEAKTTKEMRPSAAFNSIIDELNN